MQRLRLPGSLLSPGMNHACQVAAGKRQQRFNSQQPIPIQGLPNVKRHSSKSNTPFTFLQDLPAIRISGAAMAVKDHAFQVT
jgi:hypothetical protein